MKIISKNYKNNYVRAQIENLDDLWYLTYIIETDDTLKSVTQRKIKLGKEQDRKTKVIKRTALIAIDVEKVEFAKYSNVLRVSGKIKEAPDDIPLGSYHTINLEENSEFSLEKEQFLKYQIEKLEEAAKGTQENILIVVHDREEAHFALLKKYGYEMISHISGDVAKKAEVKTNVDDFFGLLKKTIKEYDKRYKFTRIVIASPGFWREYVQKLITEDKLKEKVIYATCSSVGVNGINEVIKRPEVQQALKEEKFTEEMERVESLLSEIAQQGKAQYGANEIKKAVEAGAVKELLITDEFIHKRRQDDTFQEIEKLMRKVDSMQGDIHIISSEHEGGRKLDGLGGMGAFLRYKLNY